MAVCGKDLCGPPANFPSPCLCGSPPGPPLMWPSGTREPGYTARKLSLTHARTPVLAPGEIINMPPPCLAVSLSRCLAVSLSLSMSLCRRSVCLWSVTLAPSRPCRYTCSCNNGTDICNNGQSCFWFSQGVSIGCTVADGNGTRLPNLDHCAGR